MEVLLFHHRVVKVSSSLGVGSIGIGVNVENRSDKPTETRSDKGHPSGNCTAVSKSMR